MSYRLKTNSRRLIEAVNGKAYTPPERWTAAEFRERGEEMLTLLTRTAKIVQRKAWPAVITAARKTMRAQLEAVVEMARRLAGVRGAKAVDLVVWETALNEVFAQLLPELVAEVLPPLQSVADQGWSKTNAILGNTPPPEAQSFTFPTRQIAQRIVNIDETTRRRIRESIVQSIRDGLDVEETARRLIDEAETALPGWRLRTIARTEVSNAWTLSTVAAMRRTPNLISVSVVGCESREVDRWNDPSWQQFMFQGEGTCNIQGVAIGDAHLLNFHPNHTGVIVPDEFRDADGTVMISGQ